MLSRQNVINGFRWILGREPESESVIEAHRHLGTMHELRWVLLNSEEFLEYSHQNLAPKPECEISSYALDFPRIVFLHIPKTAGSSFHHLITSRYDEEDICPIRFNKITSLSLAEVVSYRVFSGHFDLASCNLIPGDLRIVTFLREPVSRLASLYNYLGAHRDEVIERDNLLLCRLAKCMDPLTFFSDERVRCHPAINNAMLQTLAATVGPRWEAPSSVTRTTEEMVQYLEMGLKNLHALTCVGITEYFEESVQLIFEQLGFDRPRTIPRLQTFEGLHAVESGFEQVEKVVFDSSTLKVISDLVKYDEVLYKSGLAQFKIMCGNSGMHAI